MFLSGHQFGPGARDVENEANWSGLMKMVLNAFKKNFDNVDQIKVELIRSLTEAINRMSFCEVKVDINDESFPWPKGHTRLTVFILIQKKINSVVF